ncbi:MAG: hypothetical protein ACYTEE_08425 [Planctomycetota bacterium]|jgi:hypothetical protein
MEREQIERLVMDSASGDLNEDAESLLKAYLAENGLEKLWAEDMYDLYETTKTVVKAKTNQSTAESSKSIYKKPLLQISYLSIGRWAAVIITVALIGAGLGRWSNQPEQIITSPSKAIFSEPQLADSSDLVIIPSEGFWHDKAMAMLEPKPVIHSEKRIQIDSLWQQYKEYIKEKRYDYE